MTTKQKTGTCLLVLCVACGCAAQAPEPAGEDTSQLRELAFLVGSWVSRSENAEVEEHWLAAKGGLMLGLNRTVTASGKTSFEYLRIEEREDGIFYVASPQGGASTAFALVELSAGRALFENPQHDFPRRILYELEPDGTLRAHIEGQVDGETVSAEWHWQPAAR
jgi:hypothetical protein